MERVLDGRFVVPLANDFEVVLEPFDQFIGVMKPVVSKSARLDQIKNGKQENRFVRSLMGTLLVPLQVVQENQGIFQNHNELL